MKKTPISKLNQIYIPRLAPLRTTEHENLLKLLPKKIVDQQSKFFITVNQNTFGMKLLLLGDEYTLHN